MTDKNDGSTGTTMKSALVTDFTPKWGETNGFITFSTTTKKPTAVGEVKKPQVLVKVSACSIAAGDLHVLWGKVPFIKPKSLPFVPGMDVSGIVEEVGEGVSSFKVGDVVFGTSGSNDMNPWGGMAEYMLLDEANCIPKPPKMDMITACCPTSAMTALHACEYVNEGDRVLVIGASGGVGCAAVQLAKNSGASFVAAVSTQEDMVKDLGADEVINYKEKNWWEVDDYVTNQFDKIIDCFGGGNFTGKADRVLKSAYRGGRFVAVVGDDSKPDMSSTWKILVFATSLLRGPYTAVLRWNPRYTTLFPYDEINGMKKVLDLIEEGKLRIPLDPSSPLPFTEEGVKKAFQVLGSGHAHGKVVVKIAE